MPTGNGLLGTLRANAPARIVNVGSVGQESIDLTDLRMDTGYDGVRAYRRAKLALAAWTFELADELARTGVVVNCIHPASLMDTAMVRVSGYPLLSTVDEGGTATLRLILDGHGTGEFYDGLRVSRAHPDAYRPEVRAALRAATDAALARD